MSDRRKILDNDRSTGVRMKSIAALIARNQNRPWPDRPVRMALAITELEVGGAERALVALAKGIDRRRFDPSVVCLGDEGPLVQVLRESGIETIVLGASPRRPIRGVAALARALKSISPQIVQSFLFHANVSARVAAIFAGRPIVVGGMRVAEREKTWHVLLESLSSGLAAGSVCVSHGVWRFARFECRIPSERLVVIPNAIDPVAYDHAEPIAKTELGLSEDSFVALFVGRLDRQKGIEHLLDAAEIVIKEHDHWRLLIVGEGPEAERVDSAIEASSSMRGRVLRTGRRDDVPRLLKTCNYLVLPSLWEGMPNVVLEAMAAGRAVIATNVEGSEELVVPGETGRLVPPGDSASLARALIEAARNPGEIRAMGAAARVRVGESYRPETIIQAYEQLWASLLGLEYEAPRSPEASVK